MRHRSAPRSAQWRISLDRRLSEGRERWKNADCDGEIPDLSAAPGFHQIEDRSANVDLHRRWSIVMRHLAGAPMRFARRRAVLPAERLAGRIERSQLRVEIDIHLI